MMTAFFGTISLVVLTFINIRIRRLMARDYGSCFTYYQAWRLDALRKMPKYDGFIKDGKCIGHGPTASCARAWYYGWYYGDKYSLKNEDELKKVIEQYNEDNGCRPNQVVGYAVIAFLLMLICYVASIFVYVFDIYYGICVEEDDFVFMAFPILYSVLFLCVGVWILKYLH